MCSQAGICKFPKTEQMRFVLVRTVQMILGTKFNRAKAGILKMLTTNYFLTLTCLKLPKLV